MKRVEELLRGELVRLAERPQPDTERLLRRVRRRRQTRRAALATLVVLAMAGVSTVAAVVLRTPGKNVVAEVRPDHLTQGGGLFFVDNRTVFRLDGACPPGKGRCDLWLAESTDGAATWHWHRVATASYQASSGDEPDYNPYRMRVFDQRRLVIEGPNQSELGDPTTHWYTADAGATWSKLPNEPHETIDEIPPLSVAQLKRLDGPIRVEVLRPDGTWALLRTPPDAGYATSYGEVVFGADGSAWAWTTDADDRPASFVSRDRGRTWRALPLPSELTAGYRDELLIGDGRTVYLFVAGRHEVWRTADDGQHWQRFAVPQPSDMDVAPQAVALLDGGLLVADNDFPQRHLYLLTATGAQLQPNDTLRPAGLYPVGACVQAVKGSTPTFDMRVTGTSLYSCDGRTWTELHP